MAVVIVVNKYWVKDGLDGSYEPAGAEQTQSVIVTFSAVVTNILDAIRYSGFNQGQVHPDKQSLTISGSINAAIHDEDNAKVWVFDLTYTTLPLDDNQAEEDENYIPDVDIDTWTYQVVVDRDKETDAALLNTAGDPYDPLPIDVISSPKITVTVKEYSAHINRVPLIGSINNAAFTLCGIAVPKYCAMFEGYKPRPYRDSEENLLFKNTFIIKLKFFKSKTGEQIGFKRESLQAGFNQIIEGEPAEIKVRSVIDPDAVPLKYTYEPVATPQMLDVDGVLTTTPYYVENVTFDLVSFAQFSLPTAYPVT